MSWSSFFPASLMWGVLLVLGTYHFESLCFKLIQILVISALEFSKFIQYIEMSHRYASASGNEAYKLDSYPPK